MLVTQVSMVVVPNLPVMAAMTQTPNGLVRRWQRMFMRELEATAVQETHTSTSGSGHLASSFSFDFAEAGPTSSSYRLRNSAHYAPYVFEGTEGPITSRSGKAMPVGKTQLGVPAGVNVVNPRGKGVVFRKAVAGQRANNIPMTAVDKVLTRRGMLRG